MMSLISFNAIIRAEFCSWPWAGSRRLHCAGRGLVTVSPHQTPCPRAQRQKSVLDFSTTPSISCACSGSFEKRTRLACASDNATTFFFSPPCRRPTAADEASYGGDLIFRINPLKRGCGSSLGQRKRQMLWKVLFLGGGISMSC